MTIRGRTAVKVIVNQETCMGMGICEGLDQDRFEVSDQGEMTIRKSEFDEAHREHIAHCVRSCPTGSLRIADD